MSHVHRCAICGIPPWCCRHRYTISYIAVIVTILMLMEGFRVLS